MNRSEYLSAKDKTLGHRAYYRQFVTLAIKNCVALHIGIDKIRNSTDESFNDIPLNNWDALIKFSSIRAMAPKLKEMGDWLGPCSAVCIAKEAARQIKEAELI